jgi:hypothetical protein
MIVDLARTLAKLASWLYYWQEATGFATIAIVAATKRHLR